MRYERDQGNRSREASTLRVLLAVAVAAGAVVLIDLVIGALK